MKIERPAWSEIWHSGKNLHDWFTENVEPINKLLAEGVEVQRSNQGGWYLHATDATDTALLINITKIKQEPYDIINCRGCGDKYYYACSGLDCMNCGVNL